mmetsp:Transcript_1845/g.4097  ORF Transcript_1845/g.4097 Transcript_1845/m.4097 type:complete len:320 (+) Transcript_1845:97-1056(+)
MAAGLRFCFLFAWVAASRALKKDAKRAYKLSNDSMLTVLAFSDVHGRIRNSPGIKNLQDLLSSEISKKIVDSTADVLIYGGDISNRPGDDVDGHEQQIAEMWTFLEWFASLNNPVKVLIAGNHDTCLDPNVMKEGDASERDKMLVFMEAQGITYLEGECKAFDIPGKGIVHILGSPLSQGHGMPQQNAFQYDSPLDANSSASYLASIKSLKDAAATSCSHPIVMIHGPPDNANTIFASANSSMIDAIMDINPTIVLSGHFHAMPVDKGGYILQDTFLTHSERRGDKVRLLMVPMKTTLGDEREKDGIFRIEPVTFHVAI